MWVEGIDADEYAEWLWRLYRQIATWSPASELREAADCAFDSSLVPDSSDGAEQGDVINAEGRGKKREDGGGDDADDGHGHKLEGRRQLASKAKARKGAATRIQSFARGKHGKQKADERGAAAVKLQAARRGQLARRQAKADADARAASTATLRARRPPPPPPPPPPKLRPPPPLPPVLAMSLRPAIQSQHLPPSTPVFGSSRRWKVAYSRALQQGYPSRDSFLVARRPTQALSRSQQWTSLAVARRGRSRQEPVFSHVLPHAGMGASYYAVGQPGPRPGFQLLARWTVVQRS